MSPGGQFIDDLGDGWVGGANSVSTAAAGNDGCGSAVSDDCSTRSTSSMQF